MKADPVCWCGNSSLSPFSTDYRICEDCCTLVSLGDSTARHAEVSDDENDFYGRQYWLDHQTKGLGLPDIHARARSDLSERNLYWLRTLLKYRLPPARVLELGCSHGGFVALLRSSGYEASGLEMSPWVVEFARQTFGVPVFIGPVEKLDFSPGSLDVIVLMDVLEHLPDPAATMAHCATLLKTDGLFLVQTPRLNPDTDYRTLLDTEDAFLTMLQADEHLYLFSKRSVDRLFRQIGIEHLEFEPAMFEQYDMYFAASRRPLTKSTDAVVEQHLLGNPDGRLILSLLDLQDREREAAGRAAESESARTARAREVDTLSGLLKESEVDRTARGEQIEILDRLLKESEADRSARGEQIETLGRLLSESETDRSARGEQIETLGRLLKDSETDRAARGEQIETLGRLLEEAEADRAARGEQIEALTSLLERLRGDHAVLKDAVSGLFSHSSFRLASRIAGWKEAGSLREWLQKDDD